MADYSPTIFPMFLGQGAMTNAVQKIWKLAEQTLEGQRIKFSSFMDCYSMFAHFSGSNLQ
jgi:hypothetical protein